MTAAVQQLPSGSSVGLCFHGVGPSVRALEPDESRYWLPRDQFLAILDAVAPLPDLELSFDDGNHSDLELALPALRERGLSGVFYVLAGRLEASGSLDADAVRELRAAGMEIGTHGLRHVPWTGLSDTELQRELVDARELLESVVGEPVVQAALPLGRYDRRVIRACKREGYTSLATSDRALARPGQWLRPRFSVREDDTPESVQAAVKAASGRFRRTTDTLRGTLKGLRRG